MNVSLSPNVAAFVAEQVRSGAYPTASDVVHAGLLRLMEGKPPRPRFQAATAAELEEKLLPGVRQLDRGEGVAGEAAMARLHARAKGRVRAHG